MAPILSAITGDPQGRIDINSRVSISAAILMGVIGPEVFIVQPGFVQGMVQYLGFSDSDAGFIASAEMFGIAATTIAMTFFAHRVNWRLIFALSLLLMFLANAACTLVTDLQFFGIARVLAGLGAGGLVSLSFAAIGLTANPDRNFGLLIMWVLIYGALGLLLMPTAYRLAGMQGVLWFFALFPLFGLPFVRHLPVNGEEHFQVEADAIDIPVPFKAMALFAMLAYFLAQGVVWAYLFRIGTAAGLSEQQVANGLTLSQFAGIGGALLAALLAHRYGRAAPLSIGIAAGAAMLFLLIGDFSLLQFSAAVIVYNFCWNLVHPFLLAAMASFDRRGRVVVYAVAMQMLGLAFGPGLAALVIDEGSYVNVNWLGAALFAASLLLILPPVRVQARLYANNRRLMA
ncbi:MAG: MFS transporter [Gammaproteobacteria bacterium]|nr:MAG: MFS transporter [Gammaproteobacteria bacterium]